MGSIKSETCNNIACRIWSFCTENKFWVSAAHMPGKNNIDADQQSRILQDATEWKLHPELFQKIVDKFGKPDRDLFASRINKQLKRYVSWRPEPEAMAVNVFSFTWNNNFLYMLPPVSLLGRVLVKMNRNKTEAVSVTRLVNSILVPLANADEQPQATLYSAITKKIRFLHTNPPRTIHYI